MPEKPVKALLSTNLAKRRQLVQLSRTLKLDTNVVSPFKGNLKSISPEMIQRRESKSQMSGHYNVILKRGDRYELFTSRSKIFSIKNNLSVLHQSNWNLKKCKVDKFSYPLFKLNKLFRLFIVNFTLKQFNLFCLKKVLRMIKNAQYNKLYLTFRNLKMRSSSRKKVNLRVFKKMPTTDVVVINKPVINSIINNDRQTYDDFGLDQDDLDLINGVSSGSDTEDNQQKDNLSDEDYDDDAYS